MEVINNIPEVLELSWGPEFNSDWTRIIPFTGDAEAGKNYLDLYKISEDPITKKVDWDALLSKFKHA